ncbi:hypothetical protein AUJ67_07170 [Candidatus Desantisbacteria bacterium CG1_02_49_89]|nr:MAG: hypothetical protein AUJ67_07170 [Candidatus Desantisbacteria bacterium CG1_02_49_89]
MREKWLESFVDPESKRPLLLRKGAPIKGNIVSGMLSAEGGRRGYPVVRGIPRFVPGKLWTETRSTKSKKMQTGMSFGDKWRLGSARVLGRTWAEKKVLEEQFLAMFAAESLSRLRGVFRDGANCLNAGCGVAWSEYLFNINRKTSRFAVDLSLAVEVAYEKTKDIANVCVAQADLFSLPFRNGFFDIIFSNGVLHHTGNARRSFNALCRLLKPGGTMGIYIYCLKPFVRELADRHVRGKTTEMRFEDCLGFSEKITKLGKALQKIKEPLVVTEDIPLLGIKKGRYGLQKFIYDHFLKCFYSAAAGYDFSVLTNVDWYHPKYATHHSKEEVISWFEGNGIKNIRCIQPKGWEYSGYFVSGRKK